MTVITEHATYQIMQTGRGVFSILMTDTPHEETEYLLCTSGKLGVHRITGKDELSESEPIETKELCIRLGGNFLFREGELIQQDTSCCDFSNKIVEILP